MAGNVKALPTYYNGIEFRSRLEARWAWLFDYWGLTWRYEPQGFSVHTDYCGLVDPDDEFSQCEGFSTGEFCSGSDTCDKKHGCHCFNYLPDFYVDGRWVEVKGHLSARDAWKIGNATFHRRGIPADPHGKPWQEANSYEPRIVVLGSLGNRMWFTWWCKGVSKMQEMRPIESRSDWDTMFDGRWTHQRGWRSFDELHYDGHIWNDWGDARDHTISEVMERFNTADRMPRGDAYRAAGIRFDNGRIT